MARTSKIAIMVDDEVKKKMEYMAGGMGLTVSSLGSFIIGQWLFTQEKALTGFMDVGKEIMRRSVESEK